MRRNTLDIKLCDFGLSKVKTRGSTSSVMTSCVGTPAWMAPEVQVQEGKGYTKAADLYSYGVIVWWMVTQQVVPHPPLLVPADCAKLWDYIVKQCTGDPYNRLKPHELIKVPSPL
eukprot:COSAG01_NODE_3992_length_5457_cov_5.077081_3_plen_115_part_00